MTKPEAENIEYDHFYDDQTGAMGIKLNDTIIVPAIYDHVQPFSDGYFAVRIGEKSGFVDTEGKLLFSLTESIDYSDFSEGLAAAYINEQYGYIDTTGTVVIPPAFQFANKFSNGLAVVRRERMHGVIDRTGKLLIPFRYEQLFSFNPEGYAIFGFQDQFFGVINSKGEEVLPAEFVSMEFISNHTVDVIKQEGDGTFTSGIVDLKTKQITWDNRMDERNEERRIYTTLKEGFATIIKDYWAKGCPCQFPRFVDAVTMDGSFQSTDWELLFELAYETFEAVEPPSPKFDYAYACPKCGSKYSIKVHQYSAFFISLESEVSINPKLNLLGAPKKKPIPMAVAPCYQEEPLVESDRYELADVKTVLDYFAAN